RRSFGARPIRVVTSGNHGVGHLERKPADTPERIKYQQETTLAQARWLGLSSNAKQIFARNSSEYVQFDEPQTVVTAIPEVFDQTRQVRALPTSVRVPGSVFRDCPDGPEMVVIAGKAQFHAAQPTRAQWSQLNSS